MNIIKVVDAHCGAGKSSFAIQTINQSPDKRFIYCSPFLSELKRIIGSTGSNRFHEPEFQIEDSKTHYKTHSTKLESFHALLRAHADIASTHSNFLNANEETMALLKDAHYTLFLDEVLDVVQRFDAISSVANCERQKTDEEDLVNLLNCGYIQIPPESGQVQWTGNQWAQFSELERLSNKGKVYCAKNSMLLNVFPPEIFSLFEEVYVFTYCFFGTPLRAYFDKYDIPYEVVSVERVDEEYRLTDYNAEAEYAFRQTVKSLISIYTGKTKYNNTALSRSWMEKASEKALKRLSAGAEYFFHTIARAKCKDAMWTCFAPFRKKLQPKGYVWTRWFNEAERGLKEAEKEKINKKRSCFVPCNARASNDYRDRRALAYMLNLYPPAELEAFFTCIGKRVSFSRDEYALQSLIQWIFRSRIRDGKPIDLFLPSIRMQKLLIGWMDGVDLLKQAAA